MSRRTKIICTLGPASSEMSILKKMVSQGMNIARINFSHGPAEQHAKFIHTIRRLNEKRSSAVRILGDLEGYRIRIGNLRNPFLLKKNRHIFMSHKEDRSCDCLPFDFTGDLKKIRKGLFVFIDDGNIALEVVGHQKDRIKLKVHQGGFVKARKGINIPGLRLGLNVMTPKDQKDLLFGIKHELDYVAQSFVRNKKDIQRVVDLVKPRLPHCRIIAKIENEEGLKNIDGIMSACDGIMVARGDLGVSMPIYKIALIQKDLIRRCNRKKKIVITATQMLESMTEHSRPTRAEVTDISNAILDGTDMVMLSAETAVGHYPSASVAMMRQIIEFTEKARGFQKKGNLF